MGKNRYLSLTKTKMHNIMMVVYLPYWFHSTRQGIYFHWQLMMNKFRQSKKHLRRNSLLINWNWSLPSSKRKENIKTRTLTWQQLKKLKRLHWTHWSALTSTPWDSITHHSICMRNSRGKGWDRMRKNSLIFYKAQTSILNCPFKSMPGKINTSQENHVSSTQFKLAMNGTSTIKLIMMSIILLPKRFKAISSTFSIQIWLIKQKHLSTSWRPQTHLILSWLGLMLDPLMKILHLR